jgi:hypothetical protein
MEGGQPEGCPNKPAIMKQARQKAAPDNGHKKATG